jgi:hypothetical protein
MGIQVLEIAHDRLDVRGLLMELMLMIRNMKGYLVPSDTDSDGGDLMHWPTEVCDEFYEGIKPQRAGTFQYAALSIRNDTEPCELKEVENILPLVRSDFHGTSF